MKPISECRTVQELLASRERWTQGTYARNELLADVAPEDQQACCFCLVGALHRIYGHGVAMLQAMSKLRAVLRDKRERDDLTLTQFNDSRTYEEVLALVCEAGI